MAVSIVKQSSRGSSRGTETPGSFDAAPPSAVASSETTTSFGSSRVPPCWVAASSRVAAAPRLAAREGAGPEPAAPSSRLFAAALGLYVWAFLSLMAFPLLPLYCRCPSILRLRSPRARSAQPCRAARKQLPRPRAASLMSAAQSLRPLENTAFRPQQPNRAAGDSGRPIVGSFPAAMALSERHGRYAAPPDSRAKLILCRGASQPISSSHFESFQD